MQVKRNVRTKRKYYCRTPNFVEYIIACLKRANELDLITALDDYERRSIWNKRQFAENADLEEVHAIMAKIGFPLSIVGFDATQRTLGANSEVFLRGKNGRPFKGGTKQLTDKDFLKVTREFQKDKKIDKVIDYAAKHKFFVCAGRDMMRALTLNSQLMNGIFFSPNRDFKSMITLMSKNFDKVDRNKFNQDYTAMRTVLEIFANVFISKNIAGLNSDDIGFLILLSRNDDAPISLAKITEALAHRRHSQSTYRTALKLKQLGMVELWTGKATKADPTPTKRHYTLTAKGWSTLDLILKSYFSGVNLWKGINLKDETIQPTINGSIKTNGTEISKQLS